MHPLFKRVSRNDWLEKHQTISNNFFWVMGWHRFLILPFYLPYCSKLFKWSRIHFYNQKKKTKRNLQIRHLERSIILAFISVGVLQPPYTPKSHCGTGFIHWLSNAHNDGRTLLDHRWSVWDMEAFGCCFQRQDSGRLPSCQTLNNPTFSISK